MEDILSKLRKSPPPLDVEDTLSEHRHSHYPDIEDTFSKRCHPLTPEMTTKSSKRSQSLTPDMTDTLCKRSYPLTPEMPTKSSKRSQSLTPAMTDKLSKWKQSPTPTAEKSFFGKRPLVKTKSVEEIISKFENRNFEKLAPHLASQISNNVTLQKAIFDIIEEEGYALIKRRQDACKQSQSVDLLYRGKSLEDLADKAKEYSNLDLEYLRKVSEIQKSGTFTDSEIIKGLKSLIDDSNYQGPRKLFLCSFLCNVVETINTSTAIESAAIKKAYTNTVRDFKSTSDAIAAINEPVSLAAIENQQNSIVQSILESLISISFQSMFEKDKEERYRKVVVRELLRKFMSDKLYVHRRITFHASVQIRNCFACYFKNRLHYLRKTSLRMSKPPRPRPAQSLSHLRRENSFLDKGSVRQPDIFHDSESFPQKSDLPQKNNEPEFTVAFKRTRTKVFRDKARKMEDFRTQYVIKLCVSNMLESMSREYRVRVANRRRHYADICQNVLSSIATESQFSELVSYVVQDLLAKYLYHRLRDFRKQLDDSYEFLDRSNAHRIERSELVRLQTFHREKAKRGSEIVERVCYSPIPNHENLIPAEAEASLDHTDSFCSYQSLTNDFGPQFNDFSCQATLDTRPPQQTHHDVSGISPIKEYITSTTQIIPGDFNPSASGSMTSLLSQTEITSTHTEATQTDALPASHLEVKLPKYGKQPNVKKKKPPSGADRPEIIRSRSLDSALGDDSLTSSASYSSRGNYKFT